MGGQARRLSAVLDRERPVLCLCLAQARTADVVLVAKASGYDAVYVDLEHSTTPLDVTSMLCTTALGAGLLPLVRVASLDRATITRVLDGGALGVIVPHIETAEQARSIVDVCRFPPLGQRSIYGATPVTAYEQRPMAEQLARLDAEAVVVPMVESAQGIDNIDKIAATDGVDMVLVGIYDLSADLGVPGRLDDPSVRDALLTVADACAAHRCRFGIAGLNDQHLLAELIGRGLGFISVGTDIGLLQQAATERVAETQALIEQATSDDQSPSEEVGRP